MDIRNKKEVVGEMLSLLYPRRCPVCQGIVAEEGSRICASCRDQIAFVREPVCQCCGKPVLNWEVERCYDCSRHHRSFQNGISLMLYDEVGRATMKGFKFQGRQEYAAYYIEEIVSRYKTKLEKLQADAILPVPVHISKRRSRGYNQAELLGKELSERLGIPMYTDILVRERRTTAQKELNASERQRNLESAMQVKGDVSGLERVILVDDIFTTGSTMEACTRVLRRAGIPWVFPVTVCIGDNN